MAKLVKKMGCGGIDQTPPTHIVQNNISSDTLRFLTSFFLGDFQGCSKVTLGDVIHQTEKIIKKHRYHQYYCSWKNYGSIELLIKSIWLCI